MYRHLSFQLAALAKKFEKRSNFGVRERRDSFVYASVLSVPTKRYHIDGCNCTRYFITIQIKNVHKNFFVYSAKT